MKLNDYLILRNVYFPISENQNSIPYEYWPWLYCSESALTMIFFGVLITIYITTVLLQIPWLNYG